MDAITIISRKDTVLSISAIHLRQSVIISHLSFLYHFFSQYSENSLDRRRKDWHFTYKLFEVRSKKIYANIDRKMRICLKRVILSVFFFYRINKLSPILPYLKSMTTNFFYWRQSEICRLVNCTLGLDRAYELAGGVVV